MKVSCEWRRQGVKVETWNLKKILELKELDINLVLSEVRVLDHKKNEQMKQMTGNEMIRNK